MNRCTKCDLFAERREIRVVSLRPADWKAVYCVGRQETTSRVSDRTVVLLFIVSSDTVIPRKRPASFTKTMLGLHKEHWPT
jgi:hypothetical protein